jgi:hypothetical protein
VKIFASVSECESSVSASVSECQFSVGASLQWESILSFGGREQVRGDVSMAGKTETVQG